MKTNGMILASLLAGAVFAQGVRLAEAQNLVSSSAPIAPDGSGLFGDAPDSGAYAEGVRAINQGRWSDAIAIFTRVADQADQHADGALYWKAYAFSKQGQAGSALEFCDKLRREHPGSNWIEECGALEIEIHAKSGQPVQPGAQDSDDLKLLALANLMQHDEKRALAEIDEIVNSDSSEKLKQGALFIMGQHHTDTIYPQIARISYIQGDVRVARGEEKNRHKGDAWEMAAADLPLESGFSLVTGSDGRAEIELEDASTLYLGENSVLIFNNLHTTAGIPYTELALLSGTISLHVRPYVAGEIFILHTPTDNIVTKYPGSSRFRVNSFSDGIGITPIGSGVVLGLAGSERQGLIPGQTLYFKDGRRILDAGPIHAPDFSSWDQWVADRFSARSAAMEALEKAAGLTAPLPGLADLQGRGNFFPCEPYGTCWEPSVPLKQTADASQTPTEPAQPDSASRLVSDSTPAQSTGSGSKTRNIQFIGPSAASGPPEQSADGFFFPCMPGQLQYSLVPSSFPRNGQNLYPNGYYSAVPWAWAECHAGSWLYRGHHYAWVVGGRHHHPPVHWVKYGNTVAFVPVHPRDVKDRPPVNRRNVLFAVNSKNPRMIERIESPVGRPISLLREPPKEFRNASMPALARADEPHMTAHQIREVAAVKGMPIRSTGTPITFDHRSQSFMMARQEIHAGHTVTVNAPITNSGGNLQSRAVGPSGGGGGSSGGNHSSGGGGVSAGSGSHSGGSSSSSASASSSSASSGASSSASGSGGAHH
jgi:hypothetical protein